MAVVALLLSLCIGCSSDKPSGPEESGYRVVSTVPLPDIGRKAALDGDRLYIACQDSGLVVMDVSDPSALSDLGFDASICGYDAKFASAAVGSDLAVATDGADLVTLDVSNPSNLVIRDRYELPDLIYGIWSEGALIYAAHRYEGLSILSTDENGSLNLVGSLALPGG